MLKRKADGFYTEGSGVDRKVHPIVNQGPQGINSKGHRFVGSGRDQIYQAAQTADTGPKPWPKGGKVTKTDGHMITTSDDALILQMVTITEDRWRRDKTQYISYNWAPDTGREVVKLKQRGLVAYDHAYHDPKKNAYHFVGLRLTDKGIKVLSAHGGKAFLHAPREDPADLNVKEITVTRLEGPVGPAGEKRTFKTFADADAWLTENAESAPEKGGYDKHDFKVVFKDGSVYDGRYDVHHKEDCDLKSHMRQHINWILSKEAQTEPWKKITKKQRPEAEKFKRLMDFGTEGIETGPGEALPFTAWKKDFLRKHKKELAYHEGPTDEDLRDIYNEYVQKKTGRSKIETGPGEKWIGEAIERPGALTAKIKRRYGTQGFTEDGTIKVAVLRKMAHEPGTTGRQARLALKLRSFRGPETGPARSAAAKQTSYAYKLRQQQINRYSHWKTSKLEAEYEAAKKLSKAYKKGEYNPYKENRSILSAALKRKHPKQSGKWVKMTEFETEQQAEKAAADLKAHGWGTRIKKHKTRIFNRQPSNYTLLRSAQKKGEGSGSGAKARMKEEGSSRQTYENYKIVFHYKGGRQETVKLAAMNSDDALNQALKIRKTQLKPRSIEIKDGLGDILAKIGHGVGRAVSTPGRVYREYKAGMVESLIKDMESPNKATQALARKELKEKYPNIYKYIAVEQV